MVFSPTDLKTLNMAILENIRKRTTVLILIIGIALFAFVISDVLTRGGVGGPKVGSTVGEVNGEPISIEAFRKSMEVASNQSQATSTQLVNAVWDREVRTAILNQQFEELGLQIESDQVLDLIRNNPSFAQNPQFQDENGFFDETAFLNFIADLRVNAPQQYELWLQNENALIQTAKEQRYFDLITNVHIELTVLIKKLFNRDNAFGFQTGIDDYYITIDIDNFTGDDFTNAHVCLSNTFLKQLCKTF